MYMYIAGQFTQAMLRRPFHSLEGAVMGKLLERFPSMPGTLLKRKSISRHFQQFCLAYNQNINTF